MGSEKTRYKVNIKYNNEGLAVEQVREIKEIIKKILISEAKKQYSAQVAYGNKKG